MRSFFLRQFLTVHVLLTCYTVGFEFPTSFSADVAIISKLDVTSNCADSVTYACNSTCPNREDFPTLSVFIGTVSSPCKTTPTSMVSPPSAAKVSNGQIFFDATSTIGCNEKTKPYTLASPYFFTLTMWIRASCIYQTCNLFNIGNDLTMTYYGNILRFNTVPYTANRGGWHHIAIRYNGNVAWFVNGTEFKTLSSTSTSSIKVTLGPKANLTSSDYIHFLDVRWYRDALTDRELTYMYDKSFLDAGIKTNCRCPGTHPTLVAQTEYAKYIECTNGSTNVLRLGNNAYLPEYMLDGDTKTSWISGNVREANITLTLREQFQLKRITLTGVKNQPSNMNIILLRSGTQTNVIPVSGTETFTHNFEQITVTARSAYEKLVANKVTIQAKFTTNNHFTVNELKLEARCACYGNDKACVIQTGGTYQCSCDSTSNTGNKHCDYCQPEYYRKTEEFDCSHPCGCNSTGSKHNICAQIGGQCACHTNVDKTKCSECKHNTANFSDIGCEQCPCNPDGITSCSDGLICNCKENVENSTGTCDSCIQNYYNIRQPTGCTACNCDASGTRNIQSKCDKSNGQCYCKANVLGRTCNTCKDRFYGLTAENEMGCSACDCNIVGSARLECNKTNGYCPCVDGKIHDNNEKCVPRNLHLDPTFGPVAGGTQLTLTGSLLGTNNNVRLSIDGSEQNVVSRNESIVIFKSKKGTEGVKEVFLEWTRENLKYAAFENNITFEYKKNPQIIVPTENIRSFASGGCTLRMQGSNLDSVPYPKMIVHLQDNSNVDSPCKAEDDGFLRCPTPDMGNHSTDSQYDIGFRFDGQNIYENASAKYGVMLTVVPDPFVDTGMSETYRNTFDKTFKIKGERLNEACHDGDVTIMLGDKNCALLSRTQESISCDPGEEFPGTARTVQVKIKIGNFQAVWGELQINSFWTNTEFIYIAVGAGVFLLLLVALTVLIVKCRRRNSYDRYGESSSPTDDLSLDKLSSSPKPAKENDYVRNPVAVIPPLENRVPEKTSQEIANDFCNRLKRGVGKIVKMSLIERSNIDLGKVCTHKGKKIRVINGQYNASTSSPYSGSNVTIKTLLEHYQEEGELPEWLSNGLQECTRLQDFVHDNVLRMKGIALDAKNLYIIYPEMSNRTLKDYLLNSKQSVTEEKKLEICIQVSEGMNYLSTSGVVHKDLAARNCWVSRDFEVKISDASFSYDIYPEEYLENNGRYQPVRWMAPESLRQGFYDSKSDSWSFGVLLWEVFANGSLPYHGTKNEDIRTKVCDEHCRLWKPKGCSDAVFGLIQECHTNKSDDRPNFYIIQNRLDHIVNPPPEEDQPLYENQAFKTATGDQDLEDYVNTAFVMTPQRPPKRP